MKFLVQHFFQAIDEANLEQQDSARDKIDPNAKMDSASIHCPLICKFCGQMAAPENSP